MDAVKIADVLITDCKFKHERNGALIGFADVFFNNGAFSWHGIKLLQSEKGTWINLPAVPSKKNPAHSFKSIRVNDEMLKVLTEIIIDEWKNTPESSQTKGE